MDVPAPPTPTPDPRSQRRREDRRLLLGQGHYIDDAPHQGELVALFVRSPHAHATIRAIDPADARAQPGIAAILTAADMHDAGAQPIPCAMNLPDRQPLIVPPRLPLAQSRVRYVGEPVALILADTIANARDAAERLAIDYDDLPSVTAMPHAIAPGAPQLWPQAPGNEAYRFQKGDRAAVDRAFANAAHIVTLELVNNRVAAAPIEPRGAAARYDHPSGRIELALSGQDVHGIRRDLAACLGLPPDRLRVNCPDVGGGFGMKNVLHPEHAALAIAARRHRRPIRWMADRTEDFTAAVHGRDNHTTARLALDPGGRFLALDVATLGNLGAYVSSFGPGAATTAPASAMGGLYAIPAIAMDVRGVFTNTVPVDAYRGAGKPEANYLIERLIDVAAFDLGLDRIALRERNLIDRFPYDGALGITIDTGQFRDNLATARTLAANGLPERRADAERRNKRLGQGITGFLETSRGALTEDGAVRFDPAGAVALVIGTQDNGQGLRTSFAQLAAARLGLPLDAFHLVQADTDQVAKGGGHGGARSLVMAGTAIRLALDAAIDKARIEAARLLQADPGQLDFAGGRFRAPEGGSITVADLVRTLPPGTLDTAAHNPNERFTFPNGIHVAEVEIDPQTGQIALTRYAAIDDYGVLINPLLTEGQVQGGVAQGIGQALMEHIHYDKATGQLLTASFADYAIPRAADLPDFAIAFNEHPTTRNPLGAKGSGQAGAIAAPQAIMNAILDAAGIRHLDMPATPQRLWQALTQAETTT